MTSLQWGFILHAYTPKSLLYYLFIILLCEYICFPGSNHFRYLLSLVTIVFRNYGCVVHRHTRSHCHELASRATGSWYQCESRTASLLTVMLHGDGRILCSSFSLLFSAWSMVIINYFQIIFSRDLPPFFFFFHPREIN